MGQKVIFGKFRKIPGYVFDDDSVEEVGVGQGAQFSKSNFM